MAGEVSAGAVLVELKAQYSDLKKNVAAAKGEMTGFGQRVDATAKSVQASGGKISDSFGAVERSTLKAAERFAKLTLTMVVMQQSLAELGTKGKGSLSSFTQATSIATDALTRFLFIFGAMPNAMGAGLGAIAAGVSIFGGLSKALAESSEQMDRVNKAVKAARDRVTKAGGKSDATILIGGPGAAVDKQIEETTATLESATIALRKYDDAVLNAENDIPKITKKIAELNEQLQQQEAGIRAAAAAGGNPTGMALSLQATRDQIKALSKEKIGTEDGIEQLRKQLVGLGVDVQKPDEGLKNLTETILKLKRISVPTKDDFLAAQANVTATSENQGLLRRFGLESSEGSNAAIASAQRAQLDAALKFNQAVRAAADRTGADTELREKILSTLIPDSYVQVLADKTKEALEQVRKESALNAIANSFGSAFSSALGDAILSGKKPMEGLADIGRSLFQNAIGEAMKQVQTGLAAALKAVSGGSDLVGGALSGILGIAGGLFASRKGKSSESFSTVRSAITDSTPVRGIVAGPSSVAIATVSQDIARANAPVVEALHVIARIANQIEKNTSGGGPAGPGGSGVLSVPTA